IRGLEFARLLINRKRVEFGLGDDRVRLGNATRRGLCELIDDIISRRRPEAFGHGGPLVRAQAERWLEAEGMRDVTSVDPTLDPRHVYSQGPPDRGEQRSVIEP